MSSFATTIPSTFFCSQLLQCKVWFSFLCTFNQIDPQKWSVSVTLRLPIKVHNLARETLCSSRWSFSPHEQQVLERKSTKPTRGDKFKFDGTLTPPFLSTANRELWKSQRSDESYSRGEDQREKEQRSHSKLHPLLLLQAIRFPLRPVTSVCARASRAGEACTWTGSLQKKPAEILFPGWTCHAILVSIDYKRRQKRKAWHVPVAAHQETHSHVCM